MTQNNRRKRFFANKLHRNLFLLVFLAALVPTIIVTFSLYYLIFNVTASQMFFPEAIVYNIIPAAKKVLSILAIALPIFILIILTLAYKTTHAIIGPFDRILRELDKYIEGTRKGYIKLRKKDKLFPLVEKINKLLDKKD